MGLFSSKTKHVYSCYATPLYEDMPPLTKQTVASAVINNRNIGSDITANIVNGILFKANQFYNYAKNGNYHWGLPEGESSHTSAMAKSNCKTVLESVEGKPVYVSSVLIEPDGIGNYVYTVKYYLLDSRLNITGSELEWIYNEGTGTYPTLTLDKIEQVSPYYPIIPVRLNNVNLAAQEGYEHASDIRKACRFLDLDVDTLYEDIDSQQEEDSSNPPEDMYVVMGTSISANTQRTNEYLFRYFQHMYGETKGSEADYLYWKENQETSEMPPSTTVTIKDSQYHATVAWDYINHEVTNETGKKGTYLVQYVSNTGRIDHGDWVESTSGVKVSYQFSSTQRLTYLVRGLVYRNLVTGNNWVSKDCDNAFGDPDDPENGEVFIIPLRRDICKQMGAIRSHDLLYEAIRLHVNDEYSYKVKWYQTGFGRIFALVVAVAISVIFQQWQAGAAIMTAVTAGLIIQNVIVAILLQPLLTVLVQDVFGEELALLVTALVTVFGVGVGFSDGALAIAATAPNISSIANATMNLYTGLKSLDFEAELASLTEQQEELTELLDAQYEEEMQQAIDVNLVTNMISNDPFNIMSASSFVSQTRWEIDKPLLLTKTTEHFTKMSQYNDLPNSTIRLDVY
ncbi:TMhelix containing protein [Vibrio phage 1.238.A._10N.261.52.F10]|uniref:TMhelix containing protein n=1 Tax=Vibrio phage 1.238.A._10N.261.52.F10 TaxID=1881231 RepID=A0A2I7RUE2_9CAUD|nr:TMhelix containing protein [Vibrio phage 1.238.A._10N.261.52.F10]AUR97286.1 TMhelix containing protein [Vibrio phage 1.238.A._10N.261.52.F10]AUR97380.1 TMhelix containing protein [Vibrio phage 1.238.B._10N.261.52.F10]